MNIFTMWWQNTPCDDNWNYIKQVIGIRYELTMTGNLCNTVLFWLFFTYIYLSQRLSGRQENYGVRKEGSEWVKKCEERGESGKEKKELYNSTTIE